MPGVDTLSEALATVAEFSAVAQMGTLLEECRPHLMIDSRSDHVIVRGPGSGRVSRRGSSEPAGAGR